MTGDGFKKPKLMNVQNVHRIEQDLRKAIHLLPYYSGIRPFTLCFWGNKLLTTIHLTDFDPACRLPSPHPFRMTNHPIRYVSGGTYIEQDPVHDGMVQVAPYYGPFG